MTRRVYLYMLNIQPSLSNTADTWTSLIFKKTGQVGQVSRHFYTFEKYYEVIFRDRNFDYHSFS